MTTPAQLQVVHAVFESVATVCDELTADFPDVAPAAAHYFRQGIAGRVPHELDEDTLDNFIAAIKNKLKQQHLGMAALLEANVVDLLVGDQLVPAVDAALDDAPLLPMTPITRGRFLPSAKKNDSQGKRNGAKVLDVAFRDVILHQLADANAVKAHSQMQAPDFNLPAVYSAAGAMRYAMRVAESLSRFSP